MLSFFLEDVVRIGPQSDRFDVNPCLLQGLSFRTILDGFVELQMTTGKLPAASPVRVLSFAKKHLIVLHYDDTYANARPVVDDGYPSL